MKISVIAIETKKEPWHEEALALYSAKIQALNPFEVIKLKSKKSSRKNQVQKIKDEGEQILKHIQGNDTIILLDEKGKNINSTDMALYLQQRADTGVRNIKFIVGGAYGVDENIKAKANITWSLSHLTMNHFVAQVVLVEQIYRSLTIQKGLPYHNE